MKKENVLYLLDKATYLLFVVLIISVIGLGILAMSVYGDAQRSCYNASGLEPFRYLCESVFPLAVSFLVFFIGVFMFAIAIGYFPICGCEK